MRILLYGLIAAFFTLLGVVPVKQIVPPAPVVVTGNMDNRSQTEEKDKIGTPISKKGTAEEKKVSTETATTGTKIEKSVPKVKATEENSPTEEKSVSNEQSKLPPQAVIPQQVTPSLTFTEINERTRIALVNITCYTTNGGLIKPISASGVLINERGIILTNAHVGQYLLLRNYGVKDFLHCVVRTGSPAYPRYVAELLYISPRWVEKNSKNLIEEEPLGTGEYDFAFLRIASTTNPQENLPENFPALSALWTASNAMPGNLVLIAGYPAGFLGGVSVERELYANSSINSIKTLLTFSENIIDVLSLGSTILAQKGSSGGAVVNDEGRLIGIPVTTSAGTTTASRDLRALTTAYIAREFFAETGTAVESFLGNNPEAEALRFNETVAPQLTKLLTDVLPHE